MLIVSVAAINADGSLKIMPLMLILTGEIGQLNCGNIDSVTVTVKLVVTMCPKVSFKM